jgi:putative heme utilization radical SAM enzyme HutW
MIKEFNASLKFIISEGPFMIRFNQNFNKKHPSEYFEKRIRSAAELKRLLPYQELSIGTLENELSQPAGQNKRCIYIHIPFCRKACNFCGYFKCVNSSPETIAMYVQRLKEQILQFSKFEWVKSASFETIYFGGGTPTAIPSALFFDLLETIYTHLPLTSDCEVTLETSVTDIDEDWFERLKGSRVNRISIGIQSFNKELRRKHSRLAGYDEICSKIEQIKRTGIKNICADLLYNLEEQTIQIWENDLKQISRLDFNGCSVYPLLPFPGAPMMQNQTYKIPDQKEEYHFFEMADTYLTNIPGWQPFTTVQYGDSFNGTASYVQLQANDADILAFGPGAGGKINNIQYLNMFSLDDFLNDSILLISPKAKVFQLTDEYELLGKKLQLFKRGLMNKKQFNAFFINDETMINELLEKNLLLETDDYFSLSQSGRFWAANLSEQFIANYRG